MKAFFALVVVGVVAFFGWQWFQFHVLDVAAVESDLRGMPVEGLIDHSELTDKQVDARLEKTLADHGLVLADQHVETVPMICKKPGAAVPGQGVLSDPGTFMRAFNVTGTLRRSRIGVTFSAPLSVSIHDLCTDGQLVPAGTPSR